MGYTDYTRRVYDPVNRTNIEVMARFTWTPEQEKSYKKILKLLDLRPGWRSNAYPAYGYRFLEDLIVERCPDMVLPER